MLITVVTILIFSLLLGIPALASASDPKEEERLARELEATRKKIKDVEQDILKIRKFNIDTLEETRLKTQAIVDLDRERQRLGKEAASDTEKEIAQA